MYVRQSVGGQHKNEHHSASSAKWENYLKKKLFCRLSNNAKIYAEATTSQLKKMLVTQSFSTSPDLFANKSLEKYGIVLFMLDIISLVVLSHNLAGHIHQVTYNFVQP